MRESAATGEKALRINLDAATHGTFAEIGAGQEVARWFFRVGGAAATVAKTISAYDMTVSDGAYGPTDRYVSRVRLEAMLAREAAELGQLLDARRGERSTFFVFADTVASRSYSHHEDGHGWLGVRFQTAPRSDFSEIVLHAYLFDTEPAREQAALGILGVNLLYGAFYHHGEPETLVASLMEGLTRKRIEIDMVKLSGPAFAQVDNRLMSLELVERAFTDAALFTADGEVVQPSEILYKKPVLVERGTFRPVTNLTIDLIEGARALFLQEPDGEAEPPVVLMEMTLRSLSSDRGVDHSDFLARAEVLHALGHHVLISSCERYFSLVEYLARCTNNMIGIALGLPSLLAIVDEQYYPDLPGGVLESAGRLFKNAVKVFVYPYRDPRSSQVVTVETLALDSSVRHLFAFLRENHRLVSIRHSSDAYLDIRTTDVLARIQSGDPTWEALVPPAIVEPIKRRQLFGYRSRAGSGAPDDAGDAPRFER
jgi:hypothetical protein